MRPCERLRIDGKGRARLNTRRAAILIVVLVVLTIVGLMSAQAIQTLLLMKGHDAKRAKLRQTDELIELGRHAMDAPMPGEKEQADPSFQLAFFEQEANVQFKIQEKLTKAEGPIRGRVVVQFPLDKESAITATWQNLDH